MKNYFGFSLTGKKLFPIWLFFHFNISITFTLLFLEIIPNHSFVLFRILGISISILMFFIPFYILKSIINNINYKDKNIKFGSTFGKFILLMIRGFIFTIFTLGIYYPWFIRSINNFFIENSSYNKGSFSFLSKGEHLFIIIFTILFSQLLLNYLTQLPFLNFELEQYPSITFIFETISSLILTIPFIYYFHKWLINLKYKNYTIKLETEFWYSFRIIGIELVLTTITAGIYYPMAMVKLYSFFAKNTIAQSDDTKKYFGFDEDNINDFMFIWGQILLTIITLFIYYPWSISKVGNRILSRTYLE